MVFNSDIFLFAFLPIVFTWFWLAKSKEHRYALLTISGYVFYGYWNWKFCFLLLFSSATSFVAAIMIDRAPDARRRRIWLVVSLVVDLTLLGFFKYYNFFAGSARAVFPSLPLPVFSVVLPVGISFYTFHTMSYILDVHAGRVKATTNVFEYFAYVCLFSQLVAGPIVRFREIEGDLERIDGPVREDWMAQGIGFFVVGLVKKVFIADTIARYINPMIVGIESLSMAAAWAVALGYTFQLYYDFSGYSDMAVGLGYMFGLRIPQNFNSPYRATGVSDFWRRWHISLSRWLRDYLYISLGGNRRGSGRTYVNLMVTMLLGGLWHGANWTFVVWGGCHGLLLSLERRFQTTVDRIPLLLRRLVTFLLVVVLWVIFRSANLHIASYWLMTMAGFHPGPAGASNVLVVAIVLCFLMVTLLPETWEFSFGIRRRWALAYALLFLVGYVSMNGRNSVFLYYQF